MLEAERVREFQAFAARLADAAGAVIRKYYRRPLLVESKSDASPVTIADREAEEVLRTAIRAAYPDHGIDDCRVDGSGGVMVEVDAHR